MMDAHNAHEILQLLQDHSIRAWLRGGWGIDALLGRQTRTHKDLDLVLVDTELGTALDVLGDLGFALASEWAENLVMDDGRPSAFVLRDGNGREIDIHVARINDDGSGVPLWEGDQQLTTEAVSGSGTIGDLKVRCYSPQMQLAVHSGDRLPPHHIADVRAIRDSFNL
jgi:lincosamide nucleotidyltransferase A/C/D/E